MPLTDKGERILNAMEAHYGSKRGESVFYASRNKGTIKGADEAQAGLTTTPSSSIPPVATDAHWGRVIRHWAKDCRGVATRGGGVRT